MARRSLHGFIFKPTDKELMQYLEGFVLGKPLKHTSDFIAVEDLYGGKEPSEIFGSGDLMTRYYFTELRRKCERGSRFLRGVGDRGTWKGQDAGKPIRVGDKTNTVMGFKKSLRYEAKKSKRKGGGAVERRGEVWLMKEYSLSDDYLREKNVVLKDVVLCRIKRVFRDTSRIRESSTLNINENDTPLEIYSWPENDDVTVSLPPSETSTLAAAAAEVSSGVDDAYGGVSAMGNDTLQPDEFIELDELWRRLENDDVTVSLPPSETSTLAAAEVSSGVDDAYGGVSTMGNDPLDELLKKTPPHDFLEDYNFWSDILTQDDIERINHPGPVPILRPN